MTDPRRELFLWLVAQGFIWIVSIHVIIGIIMLLESL